MEKSSSFVNVLIFIIYSHISGTTCQPSATMYTSKFSPVILVLWSHRLICYRRIHSCIYFNSGNRFFCYKRALNLNQIRNDLEICFILNRCPLSQIMLIVMIGPFFVDLHRYFNRVTFCRSRVNFFAIRERVFNLSK